MLDELAAILAPLEGDTPVGVDLRTDFGATSLYYRLRDARADARAAERAADAQPGADAAPPPEWRTVRQLAVAALTERTKDLEIAAWLTEALLRGEGLAGFTAGAQILAAYVRDFWEAGLYPAPDEEGLITRVAPVTGLNGEGADGTLIQPLRKTILFRRPDGAPVAFWEYLASRVLKSETDPKKRAQRLANGILPFDDLERDARAAGGAAWSAMRRTVQAAAAAWQAAGAALDTVAGRDAPPTGRVRDVLEEMLAAVALYAPAEQEAPVETAEADVTSDGGTTESAAPAGPARESRDEMLRELTRIAAYFRRTEPHSPLAYTLDEAVRRARMSWPDLLAEIVPDANARAQMLLQLGIKPV